MVMEPRLLLADEPVASLDASIRGEILALMRHLVDDTGLAILVVTHDLGLAWNIADRVAVMYLGRIVETGPTEQILGDPKHPYTRALLSVVPETREMEQQILVGEIPDPARIPSGCRFHPRCPLLQSGSLPAEIAVRCPTDDPGPVAAGALSAAACWAVSTPAAIT
jgi:peptide/nickel transport system ATP-binding protein